jgi:hypothetical protein
MQLRGIPTEKELKKKLNRKIKGKRKSKLGLRDCIEVPSAAWLNLNTVFLTMV